MVPVHSNIPASVVAGDSLSWSRSFGDYPASAGWALSYTLVGATAVQHFDATPAGDDFAVAVAASATASWTAGTYRLVETVTNGAQRVTLGTSILIVAPDLAAATTGADVRSHAEKMLASIDAWLESKAPTAGALEINGRRIQNYPLPELLAMRDKYARMVAREQAGSGFAGTRILVRL